MNFFHQRPVHPYRVVKARRCLTMNVHMIDDIHAADKSDRPVHDHDLSVQATQPSPPQRPGRCLGPELQHPYAGRLEVIGHGFRHADRAESVHQQMGFYTSQGRTLEGFGNEATGIVIFENVSFQIDFMCRQV